MDQKLRIEGQAVKDETELLDLIQEFNAGKKDLESIKRYLNNLATQGSYSMQLLVNKFRAELPNCIQQVGEDFLHNLVITSLESRMRAGDAEAKNILAMYKNTAVKKIEEA